MIKPGVQFAAAMVLMLVGAWLIGWWAVGVLVVVSGAFIALDAIMRHDDAPSASDVRRQFHDEVLERYRRAR